MTSLRLKILNAIRPLSEFIGTVHAPYSRRDVSGYHYFSVLPLLKPGMVLLSRKHGELSNLAIPGRFTHAAMYCGSHLSQHGDGGSFDVPFVVEATRHGMVDTDLISFMLSKDIVGVYRPLFATDMQMRDAANWALKQAEDAVPYDYEFDPKNKALYCSEAVWLAYKVALGADLVFTKRSTLGTETVLPQDFADATKKWEKVWSSEDMAFRSAVRHLRG